MTVLIIGIFAQGTNIHSQHNMEPSQTQAYTSFICKPHNPRVLFNSSPPHMNLMSPPAPPTLVTNKHPAQQWVVYDDGQTWLN